MRTALDDVVRSGGFLGGSLLIDTSSSARLQHPTFAPYFFARGLTVNMPTQNERSTTCQQPFSNSLRWRNHEIHVEAVILALENIEGGVMHRNDAMSLVLVLIEEFTHRISMFGR